MLSIYNRIGMMQDSKILEEDSGLKLALKSTNTAKSKKAMHAFLMLSDTDWAAERFNYHHTPKNIAAVVVMVLLALSITSG